MTRSRSRSVMPSRSSPTTKSRATAGTSSCPKSAWRGRSELKAASVLLHRRRRAGLAAGAVPRRGGRRPHRAGRFRRRRFQQPAAADPPRHARRRPVQAALRARPHRGINPDVQVETYETRADLGQRAGDLRGPTTSSSTAPTISRRATWSTTPACCSKKPNVYGSIFRFDGQASVFCAERRAVLSLPVSRSRRRPGEVPSCAEGGVLGILPGLIGCIQATEAVKLILGKGEPLIGRLLLYDALADDASASSRSAAIPKCPICGDQPDHHAS